MDLSTELKDEAIAKGLCEEWQKGWCEPDKYSLMKFYIRGVFWCMKEQYPPIQLMQENFGDMLGDNNILISGAKASINDSLVIVRGNAEYYGYYDDRFIGTIYAGDESLVDIVVMDKSIVTVHIFQNTRLAIKCSEDSNVYVYQRGGSVISRSGNIKIFDKRIE